MRKGNKGITLVALVVTIVVLLILAAVALNLVLGDNGIIAKAKEASAKTLNEQVFSEEQMNSLYAEMVNEENSVPKPPEDPDAPVIESVVVPTAQIANKSFTVVVTATDAGTGIRKYEYSNNGGGSWVDGGSSYTFNSGIKPNTQYYVRVRVTDWAGNVTYYPSATTNMEVKTKGDASGANTPVLTQDLTPVVYNASTKKWDSVNPDSDQWYSYEAATGSNDSKTSRWANAVTPDGSMWVWIPRYAYKITSQYHTGNQSSGGNIDIVFIDKDNKDINGNSYKTTYPTTASGGMNDYVVHPAFVNNPANGGWDAELAGIWVAKFEASPKEGVANTTAGDNVTTKTLQVKPTVASWRYIQESNIFDVCKNASYSATNKAALNSHQMKNTEWGAAAYLGQSKYGRNNHEVTINNSSTFITGSAGNSVSAATDVGTTNDYTSSQGVLASTTGNVYGIYDMSGGSWEYVAAYVDNGHANLDTYSSTLKSAAAKYKNVYTKNSTDDQPNNYALATPANGHFGDAIWETSGSSSSTTNWRDAWFYDYSDFPVTSNPVFIRSGNYNNTSNAGTFYFNNANGNTNSNGSFRPVLATL